MSSCVEYEKSFITSGPDPIVFYHIVNTASNLGLLLQKEQNVKWGEGPSGKQAVGKTMEHGKLCWHIFNHK